MHKESGPRIDHESESIISENDVEIIEKGLDVLRTEYFESLPTSDFPDLIVFPDVSARPLAYAVRPLVRALYEQRSKTLPKFHFIATPPTYDPSLPKGDGWVYGEVPWMMKAYVDNLEARIDGMYFDNPNWQVRRVLVIDDFVSAEANTIKLLAALFDDRAEDFHQEAPKIDLFSFTSGEEFVRQDNLAGDIQIIVGSPAGNLMYRTAGLNKDVGVTKPDIVQRHPLHKPKAVSQPLPTNQENRKRIRALRKQMEQVGETYVFNQTRGNYEQ